MNEPSLLWYILETDGRSRTIVNGVITSLSKKTPLPDDPIGGDDILIKWQRDMNRHYIGRSFSLPIEFPKLSAKILRDAMYLWNIDRRLELLIQQFNSEIIDDNTFKDRFEYLYKGDIDFSTFEDTPDTRRVKINLLDFGISQLVKAAANTEYFIPFDDDAVLVKMDGINIDNKANYSFIDIEDRSGAATGYEDLATVPFIFINKEGVSSDLAVFTQNQEQIPGDLSDYLKNNPNYIIKNNGSVANTLRLKGTLSFNCTLDGSSVVSFDFKKDDGTQYVIFDHLTLNTGQNYTQDFDFTITLNPGQRLFLFRFFHEGFVAIINYLETKAEITYVSRHPTTYIKAFRLSDIFRKICSRMGIPTSKISTPLLDSSGIVLTSGDGIRGIDGAGIKTKWQDLEKFIINVLFGSISTRETVEVRDRLVAYDDSTTTSLGSVKDIQITPATDLIFNSIRVGHKEQDIEDVNGKYDPNDVMIFSTPVKRGEGKELDLTSPYKAGPYEIEIKRINLDGRATTDDNADNEVYAIAIVESVNSFTATAGFNNTNNRIYYSVVSYEPQVGQKIRITGTTSNNIDTTITGLGYEPLVGKYMIVADALTLESALSATFTIIGLQQVELDRTITVTAGVPSPETIFNIPLTPKRILAKHYRWIRSFLYNYEPESVIFESANRNSDLVAGGLTEKANVSIGSMGERIFLPYYMSFTSKVRGDLGSIMDNTPDTAFDWDYNGNDWKGFIIEGGIAAEKDTPQVFKTLVSANNDITRLIR